MTPSQSHDRTLAYYNIDGLGELGISAMMLSFAALGWIAVQSPSCSWANSGWTALIGMQVIVLMIHCGTSAVNKRLTCPHTGPVEYRVREKALRPALVAGLLSGTLAVLLGVGTRANWNLTTPTSLVGLLLAASYAYGIARRSVSWKWIVVVMMTLGSLAIAMLPAAVIGRMAEGSWIARQFPAPVVEAFMFTFALYCALLLLSGGITLWQYITTAEVVE